VPGSGGLSYSEVKDSLVEFLKHKNLLGLDVAQYNPDRDPDGAGARRVVDLLVEALAARLTALSPAVPVATPTPDSGTTESPDSPND